MHFGVTYNTQIKRLRVQTFLGGLLIAYRMTNRIMARSKYGKIRNTACNMKYQTGSDSERFRNDSV